MNETSSESDEEILASFVGLLLNNTHKDVKLDILDCNTWSRPHTNKSATFHPVKIRSYIDIRMLKCCSILVSTRQSVAVQSVAPLICKSYILRFVKSCERKVPPLQRKQFLINLKPSSDLNSIWFLQFCGEL